MSKPPQMSIWQQWRHLAGSPAHFSFEERIFHVVSMIGIIAALIIGIYNFSTTLVYSGILSVIFATFQGFLFFLSRKFRRFRIAVLICAIQVNIIFTAGWFYNSGLTGSMPLLFLLSLALVIIITPRAVWKYMFTLNLMIVLSLIMLEYHFPRVIRQHYHNRQELFTDQAFTYTAACLLMYICTAQLRKNYDEQKKLAEAKAISLEHTGRIKDKLFHIISHDLNAPLHSIQQYLQMLEMNVLDNEERSFLQKSLGNTVLQSRNLLHNLLNWSQSQTNMMPVHMEPLQIKTQITDAIALYLPIAARKSISICIDINSSSFVSADRNMMDLIIRNLINNAIKFSYEGGKVTIDAEEIGAHHIIRVIDQGTGIPLQKQELIFSELLISTPGTKNEKGTGLGLGLCHDFASRQGGRIWFDSTPGEGTSFYLQLKKTLSTGQHT
ncbi:HAMP domain-containing sensor histidine kinase [Pedobacter sp. JY14-1]|uniref:sensor histidine kinase n=1 Tax=Pedobacter sp. JY14-1 TaxID=3034151 RepID=UPI0023E0FF95|nr:HAMP domain-containing sensor histidine kinase [Pedobacter sp. JY14-1]